MGKITLALHGGAGTILRQDLTPELEKAYHQGLQEALQAGYSLLEKGGTALDAVLAAVKNLEDNLLFNAGRGSVFTHDGNHEMDAAIMDGSNLQAGAVAAVRGIRNPVGLALEVMQHSPHVFLSGPGAAEFAQRQGIAQEPAAYFFSPLRYEQWKALQGTDEYSLDHSLPGAGDSGMGRKFGTVGAVACDAQGHLAAATSTGGMTNKQYGRIGDSPLIGCGTYANDQTCAISCTGHGELFIRAVAAYDVSALMQYRGLGLQQAMEEVVDHKLVALQGEGGMIGVDGQGNFALVFNSAGMYRAVRSSDGRQETAIYR